eukprot:316222-Ditylum_brightwellii.AAC.1
MLEAAKAPVEHLFDTHDFCGAWCKRKTLILEQKEKQQQYYCDVEKDAALYKQLTDAVVEFSTEEHLLESFHPFDTQTNEVMNTLAMKHAPKNKMYCTSTSLQNRVNIAVGVQVWGYEKFWRVVYGEFGIDVGNGIEKYLCSMDKSYTKHQDYKKETCNKNQARQG